MKTSGDSKFWFSLHGVLEQAIPIAGLTKTEMGLLLFVGVRSIKWRHIWVKTSVNEMLGKGNYPYEFASLVATQPMLSRGLTSLKERKTIITSPEKSYGRCYFKLAWPQLINLVIQNLELCNGSRKIPSVQKRRQRLGEILVSVKQVEQERRTPADENERIRRQKTQENNSTFKQEALSVEGTT